MTAETVREQAAAVGAALSAADAARLATYAELLLSWNEKINLTAITDPAEVAVKHFADSLTLLPLLPAGAFSLIDVGTGAGFPGVPLAVCRPDASLTLLDSLAKRLTFLEAVCEALRLPARRIHARAEEGGRQAALREQFDVATARAVAALPALCEYCLPFVKVGGVFLAMKGPDGEREAAEAANAVSLLGGRIREIRPVTLPPVNGECAARRIVVIDKVSPTPAAYPRTGVKIAKAPL